MTMVFAAAILLAALLLTLLFERIDWTLAAAVPLALLVLPATLLMLGAIGKNRESSN